MNSRFTHGAPLLAVAMLAACSGNNNMADASQHTGEYVFINATGDDTIRVYELSETLAPVTTITGCMAPGEIRSVPDGHVVWVVCGGTNQVAMINPATQLIEHMIDVGMRPVHTYLGPDRHSIFVGNDGSGDISIIDTETHVARRIATGAGHHKMAFATDGQGGALRFVYVSNITDATITVIDPSDHVVQNITVGALPHGMDYSFRTRRVYNCSGDMEHNVEVIATDGATPHTVIARIPLPSRCSHLDVSPDGRYAYASIGDLNQIARIDVDDHSVQLFPAGMHPDWFVQTPNALWAADVASPTVAYVNLASAAVSMLDTGAAPDAGMSGDAGTPPAHRGITGFDPWIFVPNQLDNSVSAIRSDWGHVHATLTGIPAPTQIGIGGRLGGSVYPR